MKQVYSPGCALLGYKPHLATKIYEYLDKNADNIELHTACCRSGFAFPENTVVINTCPGCDERFGSLYEGTATVTVWELLSEAPDFPFPDYDGLTLTIHDACPVREKPQVHEAVRKILKRMNINIIEDKHHGANSVCCGYSYSDELSEDDLRMKMKERTASMPPYDVCVYCVGCLGAITKGGKNARYLVDLLFNEATECA